MRTKGASQVTSVPRRAAGTACAGAARQIKKLTTAALSGRYILKSFCQNRSRFVFLVKRRHKWVSLISMRRYVVK